MPCFFCAVAFPTYTLRPCVQSLVSMKTMFRPAGLGTPFLKIFRNLSLASSLFSSLTWMLRTKTAVFPPVQTLTYSCIFGCISIFTKRPVAFFAPFSTTSWTFSLNWVVELPRKTPSTTYYFAACTCGYFM